MVVGGPSPHYPRIWVIQQNTISVGYLHIYNLYRSKKNNLLGMIGMVLKVSTGKQGPGSRNKEGRNSPILGFGSELLDYRVTQKKNGTHLFVNTERNFH